MSRKVAALTQLTSLPFLLLGLNWRSRFASGGAAARVLHMRRTVAAGPDTAVLLSTVVLR